MDERKERILRAIIQDYIKTAEPVGSRTIAKNYDLGISPATVRNEMADLEDLGFLEQPHTSAGRIPSAKGYQYYVDTLQEFEDDAAEDIPVIQELWQTHQQELDDFFVEIAKLISRISHNVSMFLAPAHDSSTITYIHVLPIDEHRAVMVVVTNTGALDNEPIYFTEPINTEELAMHAHRFNGVLHDVSIQDITQENLDKMRVTLNLQDTTYVMFCDTLYRAIAKRKLFYTIGTTSLLEQPEFNDIKRAQPLLALLEQQDELTQLLTPNSSSPIDVKIGHSNELVKDISVIQASFNVPHQVGTLAIVGPTRMEYGRIMGILAYINKCMEELQEQKKKL